MTSDDADRTADEDAAGPGLTAGSGEFGTAGNELHGLLRRLERLVDPRTVAHEVEGRAEAAWRRATREEPRVLREQIKRSVALRTGLDHPPVSVDANPAPRGQVLLVVVDQESDRRVGGKVGKAMKREGRFRLCVDAE